MNKYQKGFIVPAVIVLVVLLAGGVAYFASKKSKAPETDVTSSQNEDTTAADAPATLSASPTPKASPTPSPKTAVTTSSADTSAQALAMLTADQQVFIKKMLAIAQDTVKKLDPNLSVSIQLIKSSQYRGGRTMLAFRHATNPKIFWNMLPYYEGGDEYLSKVAGWIEGTYNSKKSE